MRTYTKYRDVLDHVQPHWGAAVAAVGLLVSSYATYKSQAAGRKNKRTVANLSNQPGGGGNSSFAPTATQFQQEHGGGAKMGDVFGKTPEGHASEPQQGLALGVKSLDAPEVRPQGFEGASMASFQQPQPVEPTKQPDAQQQQPSGSDTASQIGGYGQLAMQLYDMYNKSKQGPPAGPRPQMGPMNLQPTANRFGMQR